MGNACLRTFARKQWLLCVQMRSICMHVCHNSAYCNCLSAYGLALPRSARHSSARRMPIPRECGGSCVRLQLWRFPAGDAEACGARSSEHLEHHLHPPRRPIAMGPPQRHHTFLLLNTSAASQNFLANLCRKSVARRPLATPHGAGTPRTSTHNRTTCCLHAER